jgi:hypothetical protein
MKVAVLFAALSCFEVSVGGAAEFTFENSLPLPPGFIHHVRALLFLCRGVEHNAARY